MENLFTFKQLRCLLLQAQKDVKITDNLTYLVDDLNKIEFRPWEAFILRRLTKIAYKKYVNA